MDEPSTSLCPGCQRPMVTRRAQGLCPRCLLARAAVATEIPEHGTRPETPIPKFELVAKAFPQLEVLELIGRGGMGVVYRARQKSLDRTVALKLLSPGRDQDPQFADRFAREARTLATLSHPNIVTIHDFGFAPISPAEGGEGFYFLLMEFVDGVNLRQAMKAGRFTPEQALAIVPTICTALQYAHDRKVVHRDIKPENLLINKEGEIKIVDFGIAKILATEPKESAPEFSLSATTSPLSSHKVVLGSQTHRTTAGTPGYMAPEQRSTPQDIDHRVDIYSLGVVLYELLTGELPENRLAPPSRKIHIDVRLNEIVLRALASEPEKRYATASEFRTQLDTFTATHASSTTATGISSTIHNPRFLKSSNAYLTTPENLRTFEGQFFITKTRGQLLLDDVQLIHSRQGMDMIIPLQSIRDVSIGQYPRSMNPAGIDLLSITYEIRGESKRVLLSPMDGYFAWPSTWNSRVADWHMAIRKAVHQVQGTFPTSSPPEKLVIPGSSFGFGLMMLVPLAAALAVVWLPWQLMNQSSGSRQAPLTIPFLITLFTVFAGYFVPFFFNRRNANRTSPDHPSHPIGFILGALLLLFGGLFGIAQVAQQKRSHYEETMRQTASLTELSLKESALRESLEKLNQGVSASASELQNPALTLQLSNNFNQRIDLEKTLAQGMRREIDLQKMVPIIPLILVGLWLVLRNRHDRARSETPPRRWIQWLSAILLIPGVLLGGLGLWFAWQVANDSKWNPSPAEALVCISVWFLGAFFVLASLGLAAFARPHTQSRDGQSGLGFAVFSTVTACLLFFVLFFRSHSALAPLQPQPLRVVPATSENR